MSKIKIKKQGKENRHREKTLRLLPCNFVSFPILRFDFLNFQGGCFA